jgi:hypothetical protein
MDQGKLFVTEYPPTVAVGGAIERRTREHFWLCEECARSMTVAIRREHGQIAVRIINLSPNGGRKLDFVPEQAAVSRPQSTFSRADLAEFSFDTL